MCQKLTVFSFLWSRLFCILYFSFSFFDFIVDIHKICIFDVYLFSFYHLRFSVQIKYGYDWFGLNYLRIKYGSNKIAIHVNLILYYFISFSFFLNIICIIFGFISTKIEQKKKQWEKFKGFILFEPGNNFTLLIAISFFARIFSFVV